MWLPAAIFALVGAGAARRLRAGVRRPARPAGRARSPSRRDELEELSARRRETEALVQRAARRGPPSTSSTTSGSAPRPQRLTAVMLEVKHLAPQAGLSGIEAINYGDEAGDRTCRWSRSRSPSGAGGSYGQLRAFINLLELSPSFHQPRRDPRARRATGGRLQLQVRLSTLFLDGGARARRAAGCDRA